MSSGTPLLIKGSCYCKGIQYEVQSGTGQWIRCHCSMCRKLIGADFCTFFAVPNSKLQMKAKETMKTYRSSKEAVRSFCSTCGCSVIMKNDTESNTIWINASTLDQEIPVTKPTQIFTDNKAFWLDTLNDAPHSGDISNWEPDCAKDL
ncbi:uncharacterized protein LOC135201909 [Macrobrachium nipponense]|uniref:uncharacterized protein LOC135201909 n=1 Tax=Macrobrachium nipponense TaxID=159736 RepID=UPI0030C8AEC0